MNAMKQLLAVALLAGAAVVQAAAPVDPHGLVRATVDEIAAALDGRQRELEQDSQELYAVIDQILLPKFDTQASARLVLGRYNWQQASPEQRERFISAFYNFMLRSYAKGLLNFDQSSLTILPPTPQRRPDQAEVRTEVSLDDGTRVPVNYRLRLAGDTWKVYDVVIEGISYVQNYQSQFQAEVASRGLDAVIARLEADAARLERGEEISVPST
jgi:phospholipid transport system substrate-binding protein